MGACPFSYLIGTKKAAEYEKQQLWSVGLWGVLTLIFHFYGLDFIQLHSRIHFEFLFSSSVSYTDHFLQCI